MPEGAGERLCVFGDFCFGPVATAGIINVFGIGAHARMDYWGIGFDYQFIGLNYAEVHGDLNLLTFEGRVYPGGGAFYLAAGIAWQNIELDTELDVRVTTNAPITRVAALGSVNIPTLKLGLGVMGRNGFVLGIDLGIGIRLKSVDPKLETNLPQIPEVVEAEGEFRRAAKAWIEWLPFTVQLNVLRLGFLI